MRCTDIRKASENLMLFLLKLPTSVFVFNYVCSANYFPSIFLHLHL